MYLEQLYEQAQQLLANQHHNEAYKILKKLDTAIPNHPGILYLLATCQSFSGNKENAITTYHRVLKLKPDFVEAMNNLGLDLKYLGRNQEALTYFDMALRLQPSFFDAQLNKASTLLAMREDQAASNLLVQMLSVAPDNPMVLANLGAAHLKARNPKAALEHFKEARRLLTSNLEITKGYMASLAELKDWKRLIEEGQDLPTIQLNDPQTKDHLLKAYLHTCDWRAINAIILQADQFSSPFNALCVIEDATILKSCIVHWSEKNIRKYNSKAFSHENRKIKVGYISSDFRSHPVSYLTRGVFGSHNTDEFEIHGIAIDQFPPLDDYYREQISNACYEFHELGNLDDRSLINRLRELNFDILIDLSGYTNDYRTSFLAERCAPIQLQYLGFPGTMGVQYIDYTIGDPIITPPSHFKFYAEKIICLPECFQANDDQRKIVEATSKLGFGLPEDAFVFACFNQQIKFTPKLFDIWLNILYATPNSILWLAHANAFQVENLRAHAKSRGLPDDRLIFCERIPYEQHLGRYQFVDLVLDTFPFNGGTTTSDALWGGAPVLTLFGDAYSSRMSASLLNSLGLVELIVKTTYAYEKLAIELASNPQRLSALRQQLARNLHLSPVFNTKKFVKHFESGLKMAVDRHRKGFKPDHLLVALVD